MSELNIFERDLLGEEITSQDEGYEKLLEVIMSAQKIIAKLNNSHHEPDEIRSIFSELIGETVDENFWLLPPFYTDFGKNIKIGKNVFVNHACTFMDRGGITIEDNVLIAPKVNLITINHPIEPERRHGTVCKPIVIKENAWIGINATIMPGVTVGRNAIVSAAAVVTKDVPDNTIVAGIPARVMKTIEE